jgi:predicted DNA-binding protein (MmcQ/YjbR family)
MGRERERAIREIREHALSFPEAWEDHPWGERVAKVGKKVFVFGQVEIEGGGYVLSVKLPASGPDMLHEKFAEPTGYGLGKSGWVTLRFSPKEAIPVERIKAWIEESYRAVAPKKLVARLDAAKEARPAVPRPRRR